MGVNTMRYVGDTWRLIAMGTGERVCAGSVALVDMLFDTLRVVRGLFVMLRGVMLLKLLEFKLLAALLLPTCLNITTCIRISAPHTDSAIW